MALVPAAASNGNGISSNGQKMSVDYLILRLMTTLWGKLSIMGQMIILVKW